MQNYRNHQPAYGGYRPMPTPSAPVIPTKEKPLAMAYVPWQKWQKLYDAEKGFCSGTIFQELYLPFCGIGGCQK